MLSSAENNVVDRIDEYPYPLPTVVQTNRPGRGDMLCVPLTQTGGQIIDHECFNGFGKNRGTT